ncbi:hypothetical protein AWB78_05858 [Caballeronia calidae]|uniref:Uncharacterized protein n=1 Tax=Caballeronia calidae TaxID=1777139 RepID=A0A158DZE9_9BURK|nr:hypothetical protein AWB78_05858 [Caballeronia calidae]
MLSPDPLDFDYQITGNVLECPALAFNDGSDTYFRDHQLGRKNSSESRSKMGGLSQSF